MIFFKYDIFKPKSNYQINRFDHGFGSNLKPLIKMQSILNKILTN